jgi:hypothetical protein
MKKRGLKPKPLPPALASAAKRKALFAALLRDGDTPHTFLENKSCPAQIPNVAKGLEPKTPAKKRGAPKGNHNALRHGGFIAKRLAARAQIRRIVAQADLAIALALSPGSGGGER